jgi:hypothetical protein
MTRITADRHTKLLNALKEAQLALSGYSSEATSIPSNPSEFFALKNSEGTKQSGNVWFWLDLIRGMAKRLQVDRGEAIKDEISDQLTDVIRDLACEYDLSADRSDDVSVLKTAVSRAYDNIGDMDF